MKKIIISLIVILAVVAVILNMIPAAANSSQSRNTPEKKDNKSNSVGLIAVAKENIPSQPAATTTPSAASVAAKESAPAKKTAVSSPTPAAKTTAPVKTAASAVKIAAVSNSNTTIKWAASGLSAIGPLSSFDYSTSIRNAYKRKVEAYAKSKGITLITASVVNSMRQ
jgi:hypothetical protein